MDSRAIRDSLRGHQVDARSDRTLSISSSVIRAEVDGVPLVAVGNEHQVGAQITGLLDALHYWRIRHHGRGPLRYVVGRRTDEQEMAELLAALGSLHGALPAELDLIIEVDFEPVQVVPADFAGVGMEWLLLLQKRDAALQALPDIAQQLSGLVDDPSFRWYASVWAPRLSGRVDGLQVCTLWNSPGSVDRG